MNISFDTAGRPVVEIITAHSTVEDRAAIVADHLVNTVIGETLIVIRDEVTASTEGK